MTSYHPDEYVQYRLQRARDTIAEVQLLINNKLWNTAINRMYYACYYAVGALLMKNGVHTSSHSGARQKFGQIFVKTGKIERNLARHYTELFEKRHKGDYNDFFDFDEETVRSLYPTSQKFVDAIETILVQEPGN
jgi:uncharacterized protein (UPF0332 family)